MSKILKNIEKFNTNLFFIIFNNFNKNIFISRSFSIISKFSYYFFLIIYILGFVYIIFKNYSITFISKYLYIPFLTLILNKILRKIFKIKRPFQKFNIGINSYHKINYGFPSNHSLSAISISFCINYINSAFIFIFIIAFFTGISRIVIGVHYPLDVLAGFLVGFIMWKILILI